LCSSDADVIGPPIFWKKEKEKEHVMSMKTFDNNTTSVNVTKPDSKVTSSSNLENAPAVQSYTTGKDKGAEGPAPAMTSVLTDKGDPSTNFGGDGQSPSMLKGNSSVISSPAPSTNYGGQVAAPSTLKGQTIATHVGDK
jgi:hypothetical protein